MVNNRSQAEKDAMMDATADYQAAMAKVDEELEEEFGLSLEDFTRVDDVMELAEFELPHGVELKMELDFEEFDF